MAISEEYYAALGKFVTAFANAENELFLTLCIVSDIDLRTYQALLSGTRAKAGIGFLRRFYEAHRRVIPEHLDRSLAQLTAINTSRDFILHSGTQEDSDGLKVSNRLRSHAERSVRSMPISPATLEQMTHDLRTIDCSLLLVMLQHNQRGILRSSEDIHDLERTAQRPWLYTPPQPESKRPPSRPSPQGQKPRQKPSQE